MEVALESKPRVSYEFEVEKVIGISSDGNYQVQWAPAWVSKFHLVGCEHLIQEFLQQQQSGNKSKIHSEIHHDVPRITSEMRGSETLEAREAQELVQAQSEVEVKTEPDAELQLPNMSSEVSQVPDLSQKSMQQQSEMKVNTDIDSDKETVIPEKNVGAGLQPSRCRTKTAQDTARESEELTLTSFDAPGSLSNETVLRHNESQFSGVPQGNMPSLTNTLPPHCHSNICCRSEFGGHRTQDSPDRPYKCPHCPKTFKGKKHLTSHLRFHSGVRPFSCDQCDYSCVQKGDLIKHIRTHTGEKPYVCVICSKAFAAKGNLNHHMHKYH